MFVCCKAAEEAATACGSVLCPEDRPSPIYLIFACIMNLITLILVIINFASSGGGGEDCTNSQLRAWNGVMLAIAVVNGAFAVYIYVRFCSKLAEGLGAFDGATKILLYDWGVYVFIWFSVFNIVWLSLAGRWSSGEAVCTSLAKTAGPVVCQIIFLAGSPFVVWFSLITECCREPRHMRGDGGRPAAPAPAMMDHRPQTATPYQPVGPAHHRTPPPPSPQQQQQHHHVVYAQPVGGQPVQQQQPPPPMNPAFQQQQYQQQQHYAYPPQQQQHQQQPGTGQKAVAAVKGLFR